MNKKKTTTMDMTSGPMVKQLILFAIPLLLGNLFQMFYNTVDVLVLGNYVGKEALAAVGATSQIINIVVMFFNGVAVGGGVVIGQYYGAKNQKKLHTSIETTMAMTFVCSVFFSILGVLMVPAMLRFMSTPEDVMEAAGIYLRIYFAGISGLLVYNMGGGILRAVGDTKRPLYFLIFTSLMNIVLDLFFVLVLHAGIAGVAYATIISQFVSACLILRLLTVTKDIYQMTWKDLRIDWKILNQIMTVGLPAGIQAMITAFSNVFVQSYINFFGSSCMAGWSCYGKLDQFVFLPVQSIAQGATAFVSQNIGAKQEKRANDGTRVALVLVISVTSVAAIILFTFAKPAMVIFSKEESVIRYGAMFMRMNVLFLVINSIGHVLAGALRGRGDSKGPMVVMLSSFVVIRQIYLYVVTHFIVNNEYVVGFGYPIGWMCCASLMVAYFYFNYLRKPKQEIAV